LLFSALVLPQQATKAEQETGSAESPDTAFVYAPSDLYRLAGEYGEEGRQAYIRSRFSFDLVWPLIYALFLTTAISWVLKHAIPADSLLQQANLLPLLGTLFDYLENLSISLVMLRYPEQTAVVDSLAPVFSALKWVSLGLSFVVLLAGAAFAVWRWARRATQGPGSAGKESATDEP
jgi:hypothetical protein